MDTGTKQALDEQNTRMKKEEKDAAKALARTTQLVADLKVVGISAEVVDEDEVPYDFKSSFFIQQDEWRTNLQVWVGVNAQVSLKGVSADTKQAILWVTEPARKATMTYEIPWYSGAKISNSDISTDARRYFPVTIPGADFSDLKSAGPAKRNGNGRLYKPVTATMTSQGSKLTLLLGKDEKHQFICALPKRVSTVENAHKALRPKVSKDALRQGEWFFDPVTDKKILGELWNQTLDVAVSSEFLGVQNNIDADHAATAVAKIYNGNGYDEYAIGAVAHNRHAPLLLPGWYKVVHNLEIEVANAGDAWD